MSLVCPVLLQKCLGNFGSEVVVLGRAARQKVEHGFQLQSTAVFPAASFMIDE